MINFGIVYLSRGRISSSIRLKIREIVEISSANYKNKLDSSNMRITRVNGFFKYPLTLFADDV